MHTRETIETGSAWAVSLSPSLATNFTNGVKKEKTDGLGLKSGPVNRPVVYRFGNPPDR
jgi:hypothetical protein